MTRHASATVGLFPPKAIRIIKDKAGKDIVSELYLECVRCKCDVLIFTNKCPKCSCATVVVAERLVDPPITREYTNHYT